MGDSSIIYFISGGIVALLGAYFGAYFTVWLTQKKEMRSILDALLSEIEWNLNNADNIVNEILRENNRAPNTYFPVPRFKNSIWHMGISKGLNPRDFQETDRGYYKIEYINDQIKDRESYNLLWLAGKIDKANQSNVEKTIKVNITNETDGLIVLLRTAKKEVESIKKSLSNPNIKQYLENKFKGATLESDNQKIQLIQLLLLIGTLLAAFNLVKDWVWMYPFFALFSIIYFIVIQKPIHSKGQKDAISIISFVIATLFSGLLNGNLFISIPKASISSPIIILLYVIAILLLFILYFIVFTFILWFALKKD